MATTAVDPITTEVIRNALNSAADEMNATLIRSAYTWIIYELKDCSVALLDADHRVLGQSAGLPIFLGNLEVCTRVTEEMYGREAWQPGDVWIMNDSYLAGTHLNDITVFGPIFHDDGLVGFAASRAHWLDVGAKDAGAPMDSTEIYQEGLRLGPTKVVEGGRERRDVVDLLGRNSRFSYPAVGDLNAQIACARTGERRLSAIIERFGLETLAAARDEIFAQTERLERLAIGEIPDGVYEAEGALDNDGLSEAPVSVRVRIHIAGGDMSIDLRETDDAAAGPVNCGEAQAISACRVAYKLLVAPDLPTNGGSFAPLSVQVRRGSVVGAEEPSPCAWYFSPLGLLIDLVVKALSPVLPLKAAAASYGDSMIVGVRRARPAHGRRVLPHRADGRRLGSVGGLRRRERSDQQRQRRDEGLPDRDPRDADPAPRAQLRVPSRLGRPRQVARRQRRRPRARGRVRRGVRVALVGTVEDAGLGALRGRGRDAAGPRDQPGPRRRAPRAQGDEARACTG